MVPVAVILRSDKQILTSATCSVTPPPPPGWTQALRVQTWVMVVAILLRPPREEISTGTPHLTALERGPVQARCAGAPLRLLETPSSR